jgi:hypothetical protein
MTLICEYTVLNGHGRYIVHSCLPSYITLSLQVLFLLRQMKSIDNNETIDEEVRQRIKFQV